MAMDGTRTKKSTWNFLIYRNPQSTVEVVCSKCFDAKSSKYICYNFSKFVSVVCIMSTIARSSHAKCRQNGGAVIQRSWRFGNYRSMTVTTAAQASNIFFSKSCEKTGNRNMSMNANLSLPPQKSQWLIVTIPSDLNFQQLDIFFSKKFTPECQKWVWLMKIVVF